MHAIIDRGSNSSRVIVLLHGRGSDETDLAPVGRLIDTTATIVAVRAPFPAAPWGYGAGYAWYRFMGDTTPEPESFVTGQEALDRFVREELPAALGGVPRQLILGGFSQGGTTSLAYALRNPGTVAAVIVYSGFLATHPTVSASADTVGTTPIFWGHGDADGSIPVQFAEVGRRALQTSGASLESHTYPGMGHTISPGELGDTRDWLERVLPK